MTTQHLFHRTLLLAMVGLLAHAFIGFDPVEHGTSLQDQVRFEGACAPLGPVLPRGTSGYAMLRVGTELAQDTAVAMQAVVSCRKGTTPRAIV